VARSLHCIPEADTAATYKRRKSIPVYQIVVGKNNVNARQWRKYRVVLIAIFLMITRDIVINLQKSFDKLITNKFSKNIAGWRQRCAGNDVIVFFNEL